MMKQLERSEVEKKQARTLFDFDWLAKTEIVDSLTRLFHGKCAYCEQPVDRNSGEIDHHRPKSLYPWLAYEWENFYRACDTCFYNKKSLFPIVGERVVPGTSLDEARRHEKALLLDPCFDEPMGHLKFTVTGEVKGRRVADPGER